MLWIYILDVYDCINLCLQITDVYLSASQIVFGGVSFPRSFPAAKERAQSSAFFGSAAIILIFGLILCMD